MEKEIVIEIEINASPSRVWQVLTDFEKYPTWNPFIKKIRGTPARNEKLEVHMPDPRGGTMVFTPDVLVAEKDRELRWLGRSEGDVFNGEHCFLIDPIENNNNKVHFTQSEKFTGSMVESLEGWLDTAVKQNFEDMNRALKQNLSLLTVMFTSKNHNIRLVGAIAGSRVYNKSLFHTQTSEEREEENMIRRGYIILIIGGVLFVAGIIIAAVWAIPFASTFLQENTLINQVSIDPGRSVQATTDVTDVSRPVTVAIHVQTPEGVVRLIETVMDPSRIIVSNNEFSANLFTSFQPQNTGNHILNITNAGAAPVTIDAMFGYMPFMTAASPPPSGQVGQPLPGVDRSSLSFVIAGGVLTAIGFFTIIAGIVIVVIDSRKVRGSGGDRHGTGVTEGGITYRKD